MWYLHDVIYTMPDPLCRLILRKKFTGIWNAFLPNERYLFIHIPKNAGTLVSNSLYGRFINHYPVKLYRLTQPERLQSMRSFALLRDPATRFMSAIHHHLYQNHLSRPDLALRDILLNVSTDPFVIASRFFEDWLLRFHMRRSIHFVPQYRWISHHDAVVVKLLYKLPADRQYLHTLPDWEKANVSTAMVAKAGIPARLVEQIESYYAIDTGLYNAIPASHLLQDARELTRARLRADDC